MPHPKSEHAKKYSDMHQTAEGKARAYVDLGELKTLWFNTGTKCNLSCEHCYIESSPTNDRLNFITSDEVAFFLKEVKEEKLPVSLIGLTGGEPFLNPHIMQIITHVLEEGFEILVLTNALRAINRHYSELYELAVCYGDKLHIRVSLDHHTQEYHERERGKNTFLKTLESIKSLCEGKVNISIAGRSLPGEDLEEATKGYEQLLRNHGIDIHLDENKIVVFPEMDLSLEVPEISVGCWDILNKSPKDQMCASERMIVKRNGEDAPTVLPCTLIAYDKCFDLGKTLKKSKERVYLNHKFCAQFCVLGGASCSGAK